MQKLSYMRVLILLFVFSIPTFSQITVRIDPPSPVKGESFNVIFKVKTDSNEDPFVSFTPIGLEVLGRRKEVSLQTTMINGKFTSSRNYNLIYEMVSDRQRTARIKDISIEVGGKTYNHKTVVVKVLGQRKRASKLFLRAEVSKDKVYVGEGVDVRYYLYSRVQVGQTEIKAFPKLKGFIKRFHKVDEREQAVEHDGLVYKRSLKYSARVYPEKTGKLSIDPLRLVIQYVDGRSSPFGGIGFGFSRFRSKGVNSPRVEVNVSPLPSEEVPPHFTGLVGKHEFVFGQAKNKFVVNEAIEGTLEVRGPGALEKLEAPILYSNPALEQFDAKGEFVEIGRAEGRKTFEYTYLARANISLAEKTLPLSYFDPESGKYETVELTLPQLDVIGGSNSGSVNPITEPEKENESSPNTEMPKNPASRLAISAPLFSTSWASVPLSWPKFLNLGLFLIVIILLIELIFSRLGNLRNKGRADQLIAEIKKRGVSYSSLSQLIFLLEDKKETYEGDLEEIVKNSQMPAKDIDYFLSLISSLEEKDFSSGELSKRSARFRQSSFKALRKVIDHESI